MYRPRLSNEERPDVLLAAIREIGIATFVTPTPAGIEATLMPIVARQAAGGGLTLSAHVARANPHWRAAKDSASLAIFQGPHAYMSPDWYPTKGETGKVVPTWLYLSIHAHGRLTAIEDRAWLRRQIEELTDLNEAGRAAPWRVSDAPPAYIDSMMRGIVGLEFTVERLQGAWKLNEEESAADLAGTRRGLEAAGPPGGLLLRALDGRRPRSGSA